MSETINPNQTAVTSFPDNEPINVAQVAGSTSGLTGNGVASTATLRVSVASDSTGQVTLAAGAAVQANAGTGDFLSVAGHTRNEAFKEAMAVGGEFDDTAPVSATEGNVSPVRLTSERAFHVNVRNSTGTELGLAATPFVVAGGVAHDAASPGNPVMSGASHETIADSAPTNRLASVTDGDVTRLSATDGAIYVIPSGPQQWKARLTGTMTDTTVKASPGAGLSLYITSIVYSIGAATASSILLEESTTTAVFGPHYLEAISGRGVAVTFNTPIKITAATLLSATNTGSTTATLDVYGFTAPG